MNKSLKFVQSQCMYLQVWPMKHQVEWDLSRDYGQSAAIKDLGKLEEGKQQTVKTPLQG